MPSSDAMCFCRLARTISSAREREGQALGIAGDHPPGDVELLELYPGVAAVAVLARDVDRPELGAHLARGEPREVGLPLGRAAQVVGDHIPRRIPGRADLPWQVVVAVDENGAGEQPPRVGERRVGGLRLQGQGEDEKGEQQAVRSAASQSPRPRRRLSHHGIFSGKLSATTRTPHAPPCLPRVLPICTSSGCSRNSGQIV